MPEPLAKPLGADVPAGSIRGIGAWSLTGLVINCIIGSAIFGLPSVLSRLLGTASPLAMIAAAFMMLIIMACAIEVSSHFSDSGGVYLYVRTVFGSLAGVEIGWFWLLSAIGGGAVNANLFTFYMSGLWPDATHGWIRWATMALLIGIPTVVNYRGVRQGAILSSILVTAKLLPIIVLIVLGVSRFAKQGWVMPPATMLGHGAGPWLDALLLLVAAYGGWDLALAPTGEVKRARQTIPVALVSGLAVAAALYVLTQFITLTTIGTTSTDRPVADTASVLIGRTGALFVSIAVMLSTYGNISACILNAPRIVYALAANGDAPAAFGKLHPQFRTPALAITSYALCVWLLAASGTFVWALALGAGSLTVLYGGVCACLFRLRPQASAERLRVPAGRIFATAGIAISALLLTRLEPGQFLLMGLTALGAAANWWWASKRNSGASQHNEPRRVDHSD